MTWVVAHAERAALSIGADMVHGDKIVLRVERTPFGHSERFVGSGMTDRTPDGGNPYAPLQWSLCLLRPK